MDVPETAHAGFLAAVPGALAAHVDPARAIAQQRYMRSAMPFLGVPAPVMRRLSGTVFAAYPLTDAATWQATALTLWRQAGHRETCSWTARDSSAESSASRYAEISSPWPCIFIAF